MSGPTRILITGASGCVGQYTAETLLRRSDAHLLLLLRDPAKLTAIPADHPRVTLLVGDLRDLGPHAEAIASVHRVIHTATAWGDPERAEQVNVVAVKKLLSLLDPERLEQVIYFSTASILNRNLALLPEAMAYGTEYIQTKARCLAELEGHPLAERIVAVFPTLVFGGKVGPGDPHPTSYLTAGVAEAIPWLWLAKWLRTDASFHFIHAADIATVCTHLATTPHQANPEHREPGGGHPGALAPRLDAAAGNRPAGLADRWPGQTAEDRDQRLGSLLDPPAPLCARAGEPARALRAHELCPHPGGGAGNGRGDAPGPAAALNCFDCGEAP